MCPHLRLTPTQETLLQAYAMGNRRDRKATWQEGKRRRAVVATFLLVLVVLTAAILGSYLVVRSCVR